jgi:hypothetical protein
VCWFETLNHVLPVAWTNCITTPTIVVLYQGYDGKFRGVVPDIKKWVIFPWCVSWSKNVFYHYIHNERVGRRLCIISGLLCEPVLLRASMTRVGYDLNLDWGCLRFNSLEPFTVFDSFFHPILLYQCLFTLRKYRVLSLVNNSRKVLGCHRFYYLEPLSVLNPIYLIQLWFCIKAMTVNFEV